MRPSFVVLAKEKLISIDSILPLLMEMKSRHPDCRFLIVFPSQANKSLMTSNVHIWECLQSLDPTISVKPAGAIRLMLWSIGILFSLALRRNIILKFTDGFFMHRQFMGMLRICSNVTEVKAQILPGSIIFNKSIYKQAQLDADRCGRKQAAFDFFSGEFDRILSSLDQNVLKECYKIEVDNSRLLKVGHLRSLPAWRKYVAEAARKHQIVGKGGHVLYILTTMGKLVNSFHEPEIGELLRETLSVLKNYNGNFHTIFRPHAITDIGKLKQILAETGYSNFSIDHGHPMVLASNAIFAIGNFFSAALFDAYFMNVPIVEYSSYDRAFLESVGGASIAGPCCDFFLDRDPRMLDQTVGNLVHGVAETRRDPAVFKECFPDSAPQTFSFLERQLGFQPDDSN